MVYTDYKGLLTELQCMHDFTEMGIVISRPITHDSRYDFLVDINHIIYKIQCKTANLTKDSNAIMINTCTKNWNSGAVRLYKKEDVDYFYTCYNGISYLIPITEAQSRTKILRFSVRYNRNGETNYKRISFAKDYIFEDILLKYHNYNKPDLSFENQFKNCTQDNQNTKPIIIREKNYCIDCGKEIRSQAQRCIDCYKSKIHKEHIEDKCSRDELKAKIRTTPFVKIAEEYNVSDNAIRKWCDSYNLPKNVREIKQYSDEEWERL